MNLMVIRMKYVKINVFFLLFQHVNQSQFFVKIKTFRLQTSRVLGNR